MLHRRTGLKRKIPSLMSLLISSDETSGFKFSTATIE